MFIFEMLEILDSLTTFPKTISKPNKIQNQESKVNIFVEKPLETLNSKTGKYSEHSFWSLTSSYSMGLKWNHSLNFSVVFWINFNKIHPPPQSNEDLCQHLMLKWWTLNLRCTCLNRFYTYKPFRLSQNSIMMIQLHLQSRRISSLKHYPLRQDLQSKKIYSSNFHINWIWNS